MYFLTRVRMVVPLSPDMLKREGDIDSLILEKLRKDIELEVDERLGLIVAVIDAKASELGKILPGSPDIYFETDTTLLVFRPIKGEVIEGEITEIIQSDVFVNIGSIDARCPVNRLLSGGFRFDAREKILRDRRTKLVIRIHDILRAVVERYEYSIPIEIGPLARGHVFVPPRSIRPKSEVKIVLRANEPGLGPLTKILQEREAVLSVSGGGTK